MNEPNYEKFWKEAKEQLAYWKELCQAAEKVMATFPREVLLDQAGEDYLEFESLKQKQL